MTDPYYSLYCKQGTLEQPWQSPWACGFAGLVTCFRLLGDRTTPNDALVKKFRGFGERPQDGMTKEDAVRLARAFKYRAIHNPTSTRRDWDRFEAWFDRAFSDRHPVMLTVDSNGEQDEANHWWVIYGEPDGSSIWVMDPLGDEDPFECLGRSEVKRFASCDDGDGFVAYGAVEVSAPGRMGMMAVPPSATMLDFINNDYGYELDTGWTYEEIAAALVDNHYASLWNLGRVRPARGRGSILVSDLLGDKGKVRDAIRQWDTFFGEDQEDSIEELRAVLVDVEAHMRNRILASEADFMTHEIVLNLILIGTNLMCE